MTPQQFYVMRGMHDSEDRIIIRSHVKRALPTLWNRGGEYRLIPKEVVQNAIDSFEIYNKMTSKTTYPVVCIYWEQGVPVDNQVGRILTGE